MFSENQLSTWSNQGASTTSATTYNSVRLALEDSGSPLSGRDKEIYLQGSYRNATNIYGDSDVDVVCQLNKTFHRDISGMPIEQQQAYLAAHSAAEYSEQEFKGDVQQSLARKFGSSNVERGNRVFIVKSGAGRLTADVLPALQFRKYNWFFSRGYESYEEGIRFVALDGTAVINYPKQHIINGQAKNAEERTNGWYKPSVRMFKNVRNYLIAEAKITEDLAPSYFIECLLYNVPDYRFGTSFTATYRSVLHHLWTNPLNAYLCQNGIVPLFGNSSVQWNDLKAVTFLSALVEQLN